MALSSSDFEQRTEYERLVLDATYPLIARPAAGAVIDVTERGHRSININLNDGFELRSEFPPLGSGSSSTGSFDIRPLVFGAAWKVLDQLVETAIGHPTGQHITIANKVANATNQPPASPFSQVLWDRIVTVYNSFAEMRNSIMHRRFWLDIAADVMRGEAKTPSAPPPAPVTFDEQAAFCRAAQGVAATALSQSLTARSFSQLAWLFDQLNAHHGLGLIGGGQNVEGPIPIVKTRLEQAGDKFVLDGAYIHQEAHAGAPGASAFDLLIELVGGRSLAGQLEDVPQAMTTIDIDDPPPWLRWQ